MKVVLMVNSACNVRCKHCYLGYSGKREPADALAAVKKLRATGHEVIVAGSEVLLEPAYLESFEAAGQEYLLTNGIILDKDKSLYEMLAKHGIKDLTFSIHFGIEKKLQSVPEALVARVLGECRRRGFTGTVLTVIDPGNYRRIGEMCQRAVRYGADTIIFYRIVPTGRAENNDAYALAPKQVNSVFKQIIRARKKYSKRVLQIRLAGTFGPRPGSPGEALAVANRYCPAGRDLVAIDPQNRVYGCPFCMRPEGVIGRYENGNIIMTRDLFGGRRDTCIAHLF